MINTTENESETRQQAELMSLVFERDSRRYGRALNAETEAEEG